MRHMSAEWAISSGVRGLGGPAGFGVNGVGLECSQAVHLRWVLIVVYDHGHMQWSLTAQDVLVLPPSSCVTLTSYFTSLWLSLFICKMGMMVLCLSYDCSKD